MLALHRACPNSSAQSMADHTVLLHIESVVVLFPVPPSYRRISISTVSDPFEYAPRPSACDPASQAA
jgi:hypothetical protein